MSYALFVLAFASWMLTHLVAGITVDSPEFMTILGQAVQAGIVVVGIWHLGCWLFPEEEEEKDD